MTEKSPTEFGIIISLTQGENPPEKEEDIKNTIEQLKNTKEWKDQYDLLEPAGTDPIVPLRSRMGQQLTEDLLVKTRAAKGDLLRNIIEIVEEKGVEKAATDEDVFNITQQIGRWNQPSGFLINRSNPSSGELILNESQLTELKKDFDDKDKTLYVVKVNARC